MFYTEERFYKPLEEAALLLGNAYWDGSGICVPTKH